MTNEFEGTKNTEPVDELELDATELTPNASEDAGGNEETPEARFARMVYELQVARGWHRRKAIKFLESKARKAHAKLIKQGMARRRQLEKEGKLVDTEGLYDQAMAEARAELVDAALAEANQIEDYDPPTREF